MADWTEDDGESEEAEEYDDDPIWLPPAEDNEWWPGDDFVFDDDDDEDDGGVSAGLAAADVFMFGADQTDRVVSRPEREERRPAPSRSAKSRGRGKREGRDEFERRDADVIWNESCSGRNSACSGRNNVGPCRGNLGPCRGRGGWGVPRESAQIAALTKQIATLQAAVTAGRQRPAVAPSVPFPARVPRRARSLSPAAVVTRAQRDVTDAHVSANRALQRHNLQAQVEFYKHQLSIGVKKHRELKDKFDQLDVRYAAAVAELRSKSGDVTALSIDTEHNMSHLQALEAEIAKLRVANQQMNVDWQRRYDAKVHEVHVEGEEVVNAVAREATQKELDVRLQLHAVHERLTRELTDCQHANFLLVEQNQTLTTDLAACRQVNTDLEVQNQTSKTAVGLLERRLDDAQRQTQGLQTQSQANAERLAQMQSQAAERDVEFRQLQNLHRSVQETLQSQLDSDFAIRQGIALINESESGPAVTIAVPIDQSASTLEQVGQFVQRSVGALTFNAEQIKNGKQTVVKLRSELDRALAHMSDQDAEMARMLAHIGKCDAAAAELHTKYSRLLVDYNTARVNVSDNSSLTIEVNQLQSGNANLKANNAQLAGQVQQLQNTNADLQVENGRLTREEARLQGENGSLIRDAARLGGEIGSLTREVDRLKDENGRLIRGARVQAFDHDTEDDGLLQLEVALEAASNRVLVLSGERTNLLDQVGVLQREVARLRRAGTDLLTEHNALQHQHTIAEPVAHNVDVGSPVHPTVPGMVVEQSAPCVALLTYIGDYFRLPESLVPVPNYGTGMTIATARDILEDFLARHDAIESSLNECEGTVQQIGRVNVELRRFLREVDDYLNNWTPSSEVKLIDLPEADYGTEAVELGTAINQVTTDLMNAYNRVRGEQNRERSCSGPVKE